VCKKQTVGARGRTDVNPKNLDGPEVETWNPKKTLKKTLNPKNAKLISDFDRNFFYRFWVLSFWHNNNNYIPFFLFYSLVLLNAHSTRRSQSKY
jgi:hypothetical protein